MRRSLQTREGEAADPIGDDAHTPVEGIVHRYPDRVLLKLVHVCPVYCRFCFRREMVGPGRRQSLSRAALEAALGYIRAHPEIWEVILTGGDPLILSPRRLREVVRRARRDRARQDHPRAHPRAGGGAGPDFTPRSCARSRCRGKATYVVLHANHPRELTERARAACARIVDAGIPMLSQSVLLRGVNDDAETLGALMRAFVENRIKPYYLHHGDLAPGTAHLRTGIEEGQALMRALHGRHVRPVPADLCARHPGRPWQVAGRPELSGTGGGGSGRLRDRGLQRRPACLSAAVRAVRFTARAMIISFAGRQLGVPPHAVLQFQP